MRTVYCGNLDHLPIDYTERGYRAEIEAQVYTFKHYANGFLVLKHHVVRNFFKNESPTYL